MKIVIVGGGAGGFELAALLGRKWGKKNKADIVLVDASPTHLWKPLLHEIAAGTLNSHEDEINYMAYASRNYFHFCLGTMTGLNCQTKKIQLAPLKNANEEILPERELSYDILIMAVGSVANDFHTQGVREYCLFLDNNSQAEFFHKNLLNQMMKFAYEESNKDFNIAVVGGGATGIELIAELHNSIRIMENYGVDINPERVTFTLIEAADRLLPNLPERLSKLVLKELERLKVKVLLNEHVCEATSQSLITQSERVIPAAIKVWTAGIKAPDFLRKLDGLEVNSANQLIVKPTLQTTKDDAIFAFGDCACCPQPHSDRPVPPRAQSAHQQALFLVKALNQYINHKPLPNYVYHDYGSLITVSHYKIVGNLMGIIAKNLMVEGKIARFFYWSLYKQHQTALYGFWRVMMLTIANMLTRKVKPRLKLH